MSTTQMPIGPLVGSNNILSTPWRNYLSPLTAISWDTTSLTVDVSGSSAAATTLNFALNTGGVAVTALKLGGTDIGGDISALFNSGSNAYGGIQVSNSAPGSQGPVLTLWHNSPSPAVNDEVGYVSFYGNDSASNVQFYAQMWCRLLDPTSTSEDAQLQFQVVTAGSTLNALTLLGTSAAICPQAIPAGGTAGNGLLLSATANFGIFFGSGAPTLSAAQGSLYLRSDGSSTSTRLYVNTNGSTGWTNVTTAA